MSEKKVRLERCLLNGSSAVALRDRLISDASEFANKVDERAFHDKPGLHISYQAFLRFFEEKQPLTLDDFIIAVQFTYGWMPTINDMHGDPQRAFEAFQQLIVDGFDLHKKDLKTQSLLLALIPATNNSLVGASKLLHFARPHRYAIWDSQVFKYFYPEATMHSNKLSQLDRYLQYHQILGMLSDDSECQQAIADIRFCLLKLLPYQYQQAAKFTDLRCLEFIMYFTASRKTKSQNSPG
ncbi:hypothetical protein [Methylophaga pinxianii]|uniref:hypothetical protein n=1 Tax=Methylophaga pinxianii TaxID=2881052 RepID=UPI001CF24166|nr:hypothetical protein [Methylophaga pinxianii]MCB2426428.1 hypothetical protein [Methylophaga pinxianii]UPH44999.1 hypothetical protein LGT42_010805 [Methylophaga pinxianii]